MTARVSIDREAIVEAALDLIREGGWAAVSARGIAARLGSSTMPIYSGVGSMEELRAEAFIAAMRLLHAAQRVRRSDNEALDLAVGYVLFARDEPRLFRFVMESQKDMREGVVKAAREDRERGGIGDVEIVRQTLDGFAAPASAEDFVLRSWIYANGMAYLVAEGNLRLGEDEIARHLAEAGGAFYMFQKRKEELK